MRFIRFIPALLLSAMTASAHTLYLGNYADAIHAVDFDSANGRLGPDRVVAPIAHASFLERSADGRFLYAVAEGKPGVLAAFATGAGGALTQLNTRSSEGTGPCDIALSPDGRLIAVANYGGGSVIVHRVAADGSLDEKVAFFNTPTPPALTPTDKKPRMPTASLGRPTAACSSSPISGATACIVMHAVPMTPSRPTPASPG